MTFEGKHLVITGASGVLGSAVVSSLLGAGATCHVPLTRSRPSEELPWLARERVVVTAGVDLTDEDAVDRLYRDLPDLWGSIHLVGGFAMAPICDTSLADLDRMLAINTRTCFLCCREAVRAMRKTGRGGRIVNVTSRPALEAVGGMAAYAASKAAVASLTRTLAAELVDEEILVNAVVPSVIDSPENRRAMPGADFTRWARPKDLAHTIRYLASPKNRLSSGALLPAYGRA